MRSKHLSDIFNQTVRNGECLDFIGCLNHAGRGHIRRRGKTILAPRAAYCVHHGVTLADIVGLEVMHTCDNPTCINPNHLVLGTHTDNMRDAAVKKRLGGGGQKGDKHHRAKLSLLQVESIRKDTRVQQVIASEYGVSQSLISMIKRGLKWQQ